MQDVIGWMGASLLLLAYGLTTFKARPVTSITVNTLNIIGAAFLAASALQHQAWALVFINVVWVGIAVVNVMRLFLGK